MNPEHPSLQDLTALAYGLVGDAERDALLEHASTCPECRALLDSHMEEQALVRDALFLNARSGAAEARALERTLGALDDLGREAAPRGLGRVFALVTWRVVGRAAALMILSAALLVVLGPRQGSTGPVTIAQDQRAPVEVVSGQVYVPSEDRWALADAVPVDDWVRVGGHEALELSFNSGASARLNPGAVFRIAGDARSISLLHGVGSYIAGEEPVSLIWSQGEFRPLPGAVLDLNTAYFASDGGNDPRAMRAWLAPSRMTVQMIDGSGLFVPTHDNFLPGMLSAGEFIAMDRSDVRIRALNGGFQALSSMDWTAEVPARTLLALEHLRFQNRWVADDRNRVEGVLRSMHNTASRAQGKQYSFAVTRAASGPQVSVEPVAEGLWIVEARYTDADQRPATVSFECNSLDAARARLPQDPLVLSLFEAAVRVDTERRASRR